MNIIRISRKTLLLCYINKIFRIVSLIIHIPGIIEGIILKNTDDEIRNSRQNGSGSKKSNCLVIKNLVIKKQASKKMNKKKG